MLSIIVPHYNSYSSLVRLLKTIPDNKDIDVIVVDDKSTNVNLSDFSYANNVRIIKNNTQIKGAGVARNIGIRCAKSKFLMFADSDDFFCDDAFEIIKNYTCDPSVDIVYFSPTSVDTEGKPSDRSKKYKKIVDNYLVGKKEAIRYKFYAPWSKLYSLDFIKKNDISFQEVMYSNDVKFSVLSGHKAGKIKVSSEEVYTVVSGTNGLTAKKDVSSLMVRLSVAKEVNNYLFKIGKGHYCVNLIVILFRILMSDPKVGSGVLVSNMKFLICSLPLINRIM